MPTRSNRSVWDAYFFRLRRQNPWFNRLYNCRFYVLYHLINTLKTCYVVGYFKNPHSPGDAIRRGGKDAPSCMPDRLTENTARTTNKACPEPGRRERRVMETLPFTIPAFAGTSLRFTIDYLIPYLRSLWLNNKRRVMEFFSERAWFSGLNLV